MENVTNRTETSLATWNRVIETYAPLHVRYPPGELIYKAGSYAAGTYLVSDGFVSEYNMPQKGRPEKSLLEILGPGDLIGLEVFLGGRTELHLSCARAITETELFFFERAAFMKLIEEEGGPSPSWPRGEVRGTWRGGNGLSLPRGHSGHPLPAPWGFDR